MISVCVSPSNNETDAHQTFIVPQGRVWRFIPASNMSLRVLSFGRTKYVYLVIMAGISLRRSVGKEKPQRCFTLSLFVPLVMAVWTWQFPQL